MFLHPLMLAWLGGASVPLLVHLLSRSRYRPVEWGAMMFLTGDDRGARQTARVKQWTLLLLRMCVVGLLAVALARPVISARYASVPAAGLTTGGSAAVVIILDDSPSMGYTINGKSRLDSARQVTLQLLSALKRGDQAALLLAGNHDYQRPAFPTADLQSIASRILDLQPDFFQPDFATDLTRAADLLEHSGPVDREIYVICDSQALGWRSVNEAFAQQWQTRKSPGPLPRVTVLPVGGEESDNVAVEAIEFSDRPAIRDQPNVLQVRVRNYGSDGLVNVPVSIWTSSQKIKDTTVDLPARGVRSLSIPFCFHDTGSKIISASVRSTGLTTDDRLDVAVDVVDKLQVLFVSSDPPIAATQPTTQAIAPMRGALAASNINAINPYAVTFISTASFTADSLKRMDVLILDNVARLTVAQAKAMQLFTEAGGGLLILPGKATRASEYNSVLHGNGVNLLPAALKAPVAKPTHVVITDRQNAIFRQFPARPDPFASVFITRFFPSVPYSSDARVLAKFTSNEPFILDSIVGRGHVVLMTTAVDREWNSLPQSAVIQPLLQSLVRYLGVNAAIDRNLYPMQPIVAATDELVEEHSAFVQSLSVGTREPAIVTRVGDRTEMRYVKTAKPGIYWLQYKTGGKQKNLNFVVNAGHAQYDLTPLTGSQWKTLSDRVGFNRVDLTKVTVAQAISTQRGGREVWIDLLGMVLGLMTLEMVLSKLWSG